MARPRSKWASIAPYELPPRAPQPRDAFPEKTMVMATPHRGALSLVLALLLARSSSAQMGDKCDTCQGCWLPMASKCYLASHGTTQKVCLQHHGRWCVEGLQFQRVHLGYGPRVMDMAGKSVKILTGKAPGGPWASEVVGVSCHSARKDECRAQGGVMFFPRKVLTMANYTTSSSHNDPCSITCADIWAPAEARCTANSQMHNAFAKAVARIVKAANRHRCNTAGVAAKTDDVDTTGGASEALSMQEAAVNIGRVAIKAVCDQCIDKVAIDKAIDKVAIDQCIDQVAATTGVVAPEDPAIEAPALHQSTRMLQEAGESCPAGTYNDTNCAQVIVDWVNFGLGSGVVYNRTEIQTVDGRWVYATGEQKPRVTFSLVQERKECGGAEWDAGYTALQDCANACHGGGGGGPPTKYMDHGLCPGRCDSNGNGKCLCVLASSCILVDHDHYNI